MYIYKALRHNQSYQLLYYHDNDHHVYILEVYYKLTMRIEIVKINVVLYLYWFSYHYIDDE